MSETFEHSVFGMGHVYTFNPCGVAVGDDAYFKVDVSPAAFPDSDIIWRRNNDNVEFVGGDSGREVHVRGKAVGETGMESVFVTGKRFDLNLNDASMGVLKPNGWPSRSKLNGRWLHSDMKDVAYFFNHKFYEKAIEKGSLK